MPMVAKRARLKEARRWGRQWQRPWMAWRRSASAASAWNQAWGTARPTPLLGPQLGRQAVRQRPALAGTTAALGTACAQGLRVCWLQQRDAAQEQAPRLACAATLSCCWSWRRAGPRTGRWRSEPQSRTARRGGRPRPGQGLRSTTRMNPTPVLTLLMTRRRAGRQRPVRARRRPACGCSPCCELQAWRPSLRQRRPRSAGSSERPARRRLSLWSRTKTATRTRTRTRTRAGTAATEATGGKAPARSARRCVVLRPRPLPWGTRLRPPRPPPRARRSLALAKRWPRRGRPFDCSAVGGLCRPRSPWERASGVRC
mmetsp:Transcript_7813/g.30836  ORF Transcript_7813/g.30836 Transcript_7813/m.30836 type:complete len:314 (-) Transcript_7813:2406-3347(-)